MPLSDVEQATLLRLRKRLDQDVKDRRVDGVLIRGFKKLRAYYAGMQRLEQLGIAVPDDLRKFVTIVNWPRTYVDAIVARLHPQGFLLDGEADGELWRVWQANNLDTEFRMALVDMLVYGRGYLCVGTNADDEETPLLTVESPFQMIHEWSNRFRRVTAAARFYIDEVDGKKVRKATLYTPDATVWVTWGKNGWEQDGERDDHALGRVPVHPLVNRSQTDDRYGESEMAAIISLTDAACRALTNAQVATEVAAIPQKWAANVALADFKDPKTGKQLTTWETYFGSVWASGNKDAKFGQFSAADLNNFKAIVSLYAQLVSGDTGLPMRYLGQLADNPASEGAIRADESRLIGTAEEKQEFVNGGLEGAMRDAYLFVNSEDDPALLQMVTDWRPAGTPTQAEAAAAAVALFAAKLYSRREALRTMGKSPQQIAVIEDELRQEQSDPTLDRIAEGLLNGAGLGE